MAYVIIFNIGGVDVYSSGALNRSLTITCVLLFGTYTPRIIMPFTIGVLTIVIPNVQRLLLVDKSTSSKFVDEFATQFKPFERIYSLTIRSTS